MKDIEAGAGAHPIGSPEEINAARRKLGLPPKGMTERQWEVLQVWQRSVSLGEAARELGIAPKDVAKVVQSRGAQEWLRSEGVLDMLGLSLRSLREMERILNDPKASDRVKAAIAIHIDRKVREVGLDRLTAPSDTSGPPSMAHAATPSFDLRRIGPAFSRSQVGAIRRVVQPGNT